MPNRFVLLTILLLSVKLSTAQVGGISTYKFLELPASARISSLGGRLIAIKDEDLNNSYQNPSLLNKGMDKAIAFNTMNYFSDINYGYVAVGKHINEQWGTLSAGIQYINYGDFNTTDETGAVLGNFTAGEQAIHASWAKNYDKYFSYGTTAKAVFSQLESYKSTGILADIGATYYDSASSFTAAIVIKNIGYQFKAYHAGNPEPLPFNIQGGISKRLAKAPFRYSIVLHDLQQFDLSYTDPQETSENIDLVTGQPIEKKISFADKAARHITVGIEAIFSKNFNVRLGYDHQRRREMALEGKGSTVGFSWGVGVRIKKISFSYGSARYSLAGSSNQFSFALNLNDFTRKK